MRWLFNDFDGSVVSSKFLFPFDHGPKTTFPDLFAVCILFKIIFFLDFKEGIPVDLNSSINLFSSDDDVL